MNESTDLLSYLPEFLREYREFKAICEAENEETDAIKSGIWQILKNIFPFDCDDETLEYFEKIYNSFYKDGLQINGTTIDRRDILHMVIIMRNYPITESFINAWTESFFGKNAVNYNVDYENCTMYITTDIRLENENFFDVWLTNWLRVKIPANILITTKHVHSNETLSKYTHEELAAYTQKEIGERIV